MKIAIIGIGGIGGYYGGLLARRYSGQKDVEVVFVARGDHLKKIRTNGLQLITAKESFTVVPHSATNNPEDCGIFDLVLFCVKTYDIEESAALLKDNINEETVVVTLLNGVDNAARLEKMFPNTRVLNGCVYLSAFIVEPGTVRQASGSCKLFFGVEGTKPDAYRHIEQTLTAAGIDARFESHIAEVVWEKYIFISPLASATSYLGKTLGQVLSIEKDKMLLYSLMKEVEQVMRHQGVSLPENICETSMERIAMFPPDTKTSMQLDFERSKKTELDTFTGYIANYAKTHGISVPLHDNVYASLKQRSS
jgi:2-dehydropantoate 2-reductase